VWIGKKLLIYCSYSQCYYYYYYYYYLLQLSFHSVAVVLTLVTNKNKYKEIIQKHSKYKHAYYQNTHTFQNLFLKLSQ